ncbi:CdaR family transcriptional regulator [Synergistes jonesii]|uniref:CdaR family transcriptional regulator n=1 Tax=Synergistes jonesii TaxID=2754 RepID=UPI00248E5CC1|nr:sugar diacid recognition domain-containing protein [Synergistes jonesii]
MFKKMAQNIAESTCEVIGHNVLVTDENAVIIGCSVKKRIGTFHEPSLKVMRENKTFITQSDEAKKVGVYPGVTLPIHFFDKVIGSVSITGSPEEVERYGLLVQKQAEIMLREQAFLESNLVRERALRDLFENIASYDGSQGMGDLINLQARELGVTLSRCRMAVVLEMKGWKDESSENAYQIMVRELRSAFSHPRNVICPQRNRRVTVFVTPNRQGSNEEITQNVEETAKKFIEVLKNKGITADIAVGFPASDLNSLAMSLRSARDAMRLAGQLGLSGVFSARNLTGEALLDLLPVGKREEFAERTLAALTSRNDYEEMRDTFLGWCESPFASGEVAEKLAMHRNSLQYRLKKIRALTGKNPWNFKDAFELWAAFVLKNISSEGKTKVKAF